VSRHAEPQAASFVRAGKNTLLTAMSQNAEVFPERHVTNVTVSCTTLQPFNCFKSLQCRFFVCVKLCMSLTTEFQLKYNTKRYSPFCLEFCLELLAPVIKVMVFYPRCDHVLFFHDWIGKQLHKPKHLHL
jgi:hypothetical protein